MRQDQRAGIRPGAWFEQRRAGHLVAMAAVTAIIADEMGIPHVRFSLGLPGANGRTVGAGERTLSLDKFASIYSHPAGSFTSRL